MTDELNLENVDSVNDLADFDAADISVDAANVENADAADTVVVEDASENSENVAGETESPAEPAETVAGDSSAAQEVDPTDAGAAAVAEFSKTLRTLEASGTFSTPILATRSALKLTLNLVYKALVWKTRFSRLKCQWKRLKSTPTRVRRLLPAFAFQVMCLFVCGQMRMLVVLCAKLKALLVLLAHLRSLLLLAVRKLSI